MHVEEFFAIILFVVVFFATLGEFVAWLLFSLFLLIGLAITKIIDLFVKTPDKEVEISHLANKVYNEKGRCPIKSIFDCVQVNDAFINRSNSLKNGRYCCCAEPQLNYY